LKKVVTGSSKQKKLYSGVPSFYGYKLEEEFELVPGNWIFEIWYENKLACSKAFILE